jgi:hypothetical protein
LYLSLNCMRDYSSKLIVNVLRNDYPDIDLIIRRKLDQDIPEQLSDLKLITNIVSSFKSLKSITYLQWSRKKEGHREGGHRIGIHEDRELLLSVILLFYHPEKLLRITKERTRYGVIRKTSEILNCPLGSLKMTIPYVIIAFRAYKEFREETYRIYELIKSEHKFFE